jgi:hypothetical protein
METIYWRGMAARVTGVSRVLYGGLFHEVVLLEGPEAGATKWVSDRYLTGGR